MKYTAILNGKERNLEIVKESPHMYRVSVDGEICLFDARACTYDLFSILGCDNTSYDVAFTLEESRTHLIFRNNPNNSNYSFTIDLPDERMLKIRRAKIDEEKSGTEIINTSMPGKVISVMVKEGQNVAPGDVIVIIEAMKMQNEIRTRRGGRVKSIHIKEGQTVESNAELAKIER